MSTTKTNLHFSDKTQNLVARVQVFFWLIQQSWEDRKVAWRAKSSAWNISLIPVLPPCLPTCTTGRTWINDRHRSESGLHWIFQNDTEVWIMYGSATSDVTDPSMFDMHDSRQVLSMKYNLIAMAMAAAAEPTATTAMGTMSMTSSVSATEPTMTDSTPTTASATKCGGSHAVVPVIFVLIARFVFSS